MRHSRILIANRSHADSWGPGISPGCYVLVGPDGFLLNVGKKFSANILAVRPCALRVASHMDRGSAVEKYHDVNSAGYRRVGAEAKRPVMGPQGRGYCYEGPELLLYIQEAKTVVTYMLASGPAKGAYKGYLHAARAHDTGFDDSPVVLFGSERRTSVNIPEWFCPSIKSSDLTWRRNGRYQADIDAFYTEAAGRGETEYTVRQRILKDLNILSGQARRRFINMIEQANDGDYGFEMYDFH